MRFLDLFSGIGGFRLGMEQAGHTCVGHVEIDKFANISYQAIHRPSKEEFFRDDITKVTDEEWAELRGKVDCICGGFPCQAFSIAGHRRGFLDTRGTLFFEIARAAKQIKPRLLLLENVPGLLSHGGGQTFATILAALDEIGYNAEWQVLNSADFGVPQNRERVFIIGYPRGQSGREILSFGENDEVFDPTEQSDKSPPQTQLCRTIGTKMGSRADDTFIVESKILQIGRGYNKGGLHDISPTVTSNWFIDNNFVIQVGNLLDTDAFGGNPQTGRVYSVAGLAPTLNTMGGGQREPKVLLKNNRIRKLTPRECWRLQGFPDWAFDRAKEAGVSDTQLYKQAGNSVTVNVIYEIARRLE